MKPFTINKNSWHYRLANEYGGLERWEDDFCSYSRRVGLGLCAALLLSAVCSLLLYPLVDLAIWAYFRMFVDPVDMSTAAEIFCIIAAVLLLALAIGVFGSLREMYVESRPRVKKEPSFLTLAYRKFKDKTCVRVNYVGDNK